MTTTFRHRVLVRCLGTLLSCFATTCLHSGEPTSRPGPVSELQANATRHVVPLNTAWRTLVLQTEVSAPHAVETPAFDDASWAQVDVPHNWDRYEGFRQVRHGNHHGTAWYRRTFTIEPAERGRRMFLFFEGVGSYATVWVNGRLAGRHAGGLTSFTLDVTDFVQVGTRNLVVVRADHPAGIRDLPWVCGGCERAYGFSEGPQPFGIFRPVHLITTAPVRIEPFGVHVWNDAGAPTEPAQVHVRTEIRNYDATPRTVTLLTRIVAPAKRVLSETRTAVTLAPGGSHVIAQDPPKITHPQLWSPDTPALYTVESELVEHDVPAGLSSQRSAQSRPLDSLTTAFGIRTIRWTAPDEPDARFYLNGRPFFINGVCDYEHNLGANHAFTSEQIHARVRQMQAAGFNAFRDAHHPHNLRFQAYWDRDGLLWWTQFGAHIWFDNDAFRTNFKNLLREWVKERRNSPSLVLWGLQNESMLPTAFAEECRAIIREMDPTTSSQRLVTTCNGGTGTDWDVPQNWSGTYSGDLLAYADDLRRQHLVGEYGAWRSLGLHTEGGFQQKGPLSEDRMTALMETKVRLAESVRDEVGGHFMWPFTTHSNPGRNVGENGEQLADGIRPLDHISPANNKGLFTIWGEALDVYYMYRSNYAPAASEPMVHIVSHTWPDRWTAPGRKSGIIVYSNCDEVELFNDLGTRSLGVRTRGERGTHFKWDDVEIATNVLYAEGRVAGKVVARDVVTLHHLPEAPAHTAAERAEPDIIGPRAGRNYLYRVNCGGPDYQDTHGNRWLADRDYREGDAWGSRSWAAAFPNVSPRFGSQRKIYDPVTGTRDDRLFQTFRYGRDQLRYVFTVPNGDYELELYFIEPWYGTGENHSAAPTQNGPVGWRVFDVAVNGTTALQNLDLWREAGRAGAVKKIVRARATDERLEISFPKVTAGQAVISAIAISTANKALAAPALPQPFVTQLHVADAANAAEYSVLHALDTGHTSYSDVPGAFSTLPLELLEADWIRTASASRSTASLAIRFTVTDDATVYVAHAAPESGKPSWLSSWEPTGTWLETNAAPGTRFAIYRAPFAAGSAVTLGSNVAAGLGDTPMYCVAVTPRRPAPPAQLVDDVVAPPAGDSTPIRSGPIARASGNLRVGREIYTDAEARIVSLPGSLTDCDLIRVPRTGVDRIAFTVSDHVEVNVALDSRITERPAWLADWAVTRDTVTTTDTEARTFTLIRRRFAPDQRVDLGRNGTLPSGEPAAMYFVIVRAVRPSVLLEAETAELNGAELSDVSGATGSGAVMVVAGNPIEWTVPVGVGDRYGLTLRFTARTQTELTPAELTIIGSDGRVLRTDKLEFPPVAEPGRWTFLRARTGASINAGTYRFRITHQGATPLILDSLEVE